MILIQCPFYMCLGVYLSTVIHWLKSYSLLQDGPAYVSVFVTVLQDIFKEETVEYVLALIDEMLTGN